MHTFRYLMPLDTMERISRQKLCEDFDNVLERVDKEDIGFVIVDDEGKERPFRIRNREQIPRSTSDGSQGRHQ